MTKLKVLAGAVTLAVAAGTAQANLVNGSAGSDSEFFFIAVDPNNHTFVVDLGITYSTLQSNAASTDWFAPLNFGALVTPGDLAGQFNFGSGVQWNLTAARVKTSAPPWLASDNGVFATFNANNSSTADATLQKGTTSAALTQANNVLNKYRDATVNKASNLNTDPGTGNAFPTAVGADNHAYVFSDPTGPRTFESGWGDDFNNLAAFKTSGTVGIDDSLAFYHWYLQGSPATRQVISELLPGVWSLSQTGVLSYGAPSPVPLPGAVWLFGTGLAGLAAARRRRVTST